MARAVEVFVAVNAIAGILAFLGVRAAIRKYMPWNKDSADKDDD
jgi:hypothetical protein